MKEMSAEAIVRAANGKLTAGDLRAAVRSISTDSRTIRPGELFVPIGGKNFDGHAYIHDALDKKACGYLFERGKQPAFADPPGIMAVEVVDTLAAYGDIARAYRSGLGRLQIIGVTGSNGKTSTKDMIAALLERRRAVVKTAGTLNNFVGLPRTILGIGEETDVAVLELGMSALGEIDRLSRIAVPDIGVITNIGQTHLEFLGSVENVAKGKAELLHGLKKEGVVVLNSDDRFTEKTARLARQRTQRVVLFGIRKEADYRAAEIVEDGRSLSFTLVCAPVRETVRVSAPFTGIHNVYNILAAVAACAEYGLSFEEIAAGIGELKLPSMRLERIEIGGVTFINDAYNANPSSLQAALSAFEKMEGGGKKVFVFGDMLELGSYSDYAHAEAGGAVARSRTDVFVTIGAQARKAAVAAEAVRRAGLRVCDCQDKDQVLKVLCETVRPGDIVLLKGSRGNKLEEVIELYRKEAGGART